MPPTLAVVSIPRLLASATLASVHGVLALAYAFPDLARGTAPTAGGNRVSIVSYLDSLGPVWQTVFGLTGAAIVAGLVFPRWLALAHTLAGAGLAVFAAALWFGFAFSDPRPAILSALGYSAAVVWHMTIAATYSRMSAMAAAPRSYSRASGGPPTAPMDAVCLDPVRTPERATPRRSRHSLTEEAQ